MRAAEPGKWDAKAAQTPWNAVQLGCSGVHRAASAGGMGSIELRAASYEIAELNAEANRRRQERATQGGPLKVTDPAALARLMVEMRLKAEQQREAEAQREAERARREGANYKSKEEREREAKEAKQQFAQDEDEAKQLQRGFDPKKDYYAALGVDRCASAAEIKRSYKKLALAYHPDKHKASDAEQQAAIAERFREVAEAFDVLSNETQRAVYDKIRDYQEANPGRGLPVLSREEAAMLASGAAELRRLRRMGIKLTKHKALEREVRVSLGKLNSGGMKRVPVELQRVDANGSLLMLKRTFYLVIRKGMQEGDRITFEGEGEEAVDTQPGDLVFVLRQKPHPVFKRAGRCNLELTAKALAPGDILVALDITTLQGRRRLLHGSIFRTAAAAGGAGGMWRRVLTGQGLWDPSDPWDNPPGDLLVQVRYPGFQLGRLLVRSCLRPHAVTLLGSPTDTVAAALAGGCLLVALSHRQEAEEMLREEKEEEKEDGGVARQQGADAEASSGSGVRAQQLGTAGTISVVCLSILPVAGAGDSCGEEGAEGKDASWAPSPAAATLLALLQKRVARGVRARAIALPVALPVGEALPGGTTGCGASSEGEGGDVLGLLDDEWCALAAADVIILDVGRTCQPPSSSPGEPVWKSSARYSPAGAADTAAVDVVLQWVGCSAEGAGLQQALWGAFWRGAYIIAVGGACALLGQNPQHSMHSMASPVAAPILPWYLLRAGGGEAGWGQLHSAVKHAGAAGMQGVVGVGVMAGGACLVDPHTGSAELLAAPTRDVLVATARWAAASEAGGSSGVQDADDDYGFFVACQPEH